MNPTSKVDRRARLVATKLLRWRRTHETPALPFRGVRDPYSILVAVLMLQRTTREQVARVYPAFIERFPEPGSLARASPGELRSLLHPLGLEQRRTSLLLAVARELVKHWPSSFPSTMRELLELPGVGVYSASTILCISFGQQVPMIDVNSERIVRRVFGEAIEVRDFFRWSESDLRELNLALLDFAHYVCKARKPLCITCPLRHHCDFFYAQVSLAPAPSSPRPSR